jgi:WD40 repeat protein
MPLEDSVPQDSAPGSPHVPVALWHELKGPGVGNRGGAASSFVFAPDSRLMALGGVSPTVDLWDSYEARQVAALPGHRKSTMAGSTVSCLAFSPDGSLLASGGYDKTVRLWRVDTGDCVNVLDDFTGALVRLAFSPAVPILAAADKDAVRLSDLGSGATLPLQLPEGGVNDIAYSPDGSLLAVALGGYARRGEHPVALVNPVGGAIVGTLGDEGFPARSLAFSPDGRLLAIGLRKKEVQLRDTTTWQIVHTMKVTNFVAHMLAFNPQGVLGAAADSHVGLWDTARGAELAKVHTPLAKNSVVSALAFSPDGQLLATGNSDRHVRIYR